MFAQGGVHGDHQACPSGNPDQWGKAEGDERLHVAEENGAVVGYCCWHPDPLAMPGEVKHRIRLAVHREWLGHGVGSALMGSLEGAGRQYGAGSLRVRLRHTEPGSIAWLERRGFRVMQRMVAMVLHVPACTANLGALVARASRQQFVLTTLADELVRRPDCLMALHELRNVCFNGVPTADPSPLPGYEAFVQMDGSGHSAERVDGGVCTAARVYRDPHGNQRHKRRNAGG